MPEDIYSVYVGKQDVDMTALEDICPVDARNVDMTTLEDITSVFVGKQGVRPTVVFYSQYQSLLYLRYLLKTGCWRKHHIVWRPGFILYPSEDPRALRPWDKQQPQSVSDYISNFLNRVF